MSLLINGMDMPKNMTMRDYTFRVRQDGTAELIDRASGISHEVIDVPTPHGDLIDRDDLLAYFDRKAKGKTAEEALKLLYTALKAYPTVIGKEMN